jgi:hypothetical protein
MKKFWISLIGVLTLSLSAWALTQTGMPALDDLNNDLADHGPISRRLGFTEDQRKAIMQYIEKKAEDLRPIRDAFEASERKPGSDKKEAGNALQAAREEAFRGLKELMTAKQYDQLKAWREEGKNGNPAEAVTQIGLAALSDLREDLAANGPLARRLGFTEGQRRDILKFVEQQTESMREVKEDKQAANRKLDRKEQKGGNLKEARVEQKVAGADLVAKRENALRGLKRLMTDSQYDGLEKWLEERTDK